MSAEEHEDIKRCRQRKPGHSWGNDVLLGRLYYAHVLLFPGWFEVILKETCKCAFKGLFSWDGQCSAQFMNIK